MECACVILSSVACSAVQYFSTLSHNRHDFRKEKIIEQKICVLISSKSVFLGRTERDIMKNIYRSSSKVLVILVRF